MKLVRSVSLAIAGVCFVTSTHAITLSEDFSENPFNHGWATHGDASLFQWNSTNNVLEVTWDSAKPNSYFYKPLGATLTRTQDFALSFELNLQDVGYYVSKPNGFQLAIGMFNVNQAKSPSFLRGTGFNSPNLVEFDYFPPALYDATVSPTFISANHEFASSFNFPYELPTNTVLSITMSFTAWNQTLVTTIQESGTPLPAVQDVIVSTNFSDFQVDALAVSSYSDAGQFPGWEGSVLAHGAVSQLSLTAPGIPTSALIGSFTNSTWQTTFEADANWTFTLQRTTDFLTWTNVATTNVLQAQRITLSDTNSAAGVSLYRVRADKITP